MRRIRPWHFLLGLGGIALLAVTALAGSMLLTNRVTGIPTELQNSQPETAAVETRQFDDPVRATLRATTDPISTLTSNAAGTTTQSTCTPGAEIASGAAIAYVDEAPLIALATAIPLWRDLRPGDRGGDVRALQGELTRLGYPATADGVFSRATRDQTAAMLAKAGSSLAPGGILRRASVVWLPAPTVLIATCALEPGRMVAAGDRLATLAPRVESFRVTPATPAVLPGDRAVMVGETVVPTGADGGITEPELIERLTQLDAVRMWLTGDHVGDGLPVTWPLIESAAVASVPPAGVVGLQTAELCLVSVDGVSTRVEIVSSQLGRTLVTAADPADHLPAEIRLDLGGRRRCS